MDTNSFLFYPLDTCYLQLKKIKTILVTVISMYIANTMMKLIYLHIQL